MEKQGTWDPNVGGMAIDESIPLIYERIKYPAAVALGRLGGLRGGGPGL